MLGWTVPKECTIQNEINGNQFIQKVGRIDLGKLVWTYKAEDKRFWANLDSSKYIDNQSTIAKIFCYLYETTNFNTIITSEADKVLEQYQKAVSIKDTDYTTESDFKTAVTGVYLYYELATPITTHIDGNEILKNNYSLSETIVGTWIDGKPIYRKVIETTSPTVETGGDFLEKNIDFFRNGETHIVNMTGLIYSDSNDMVVPYIATVAGNDWCALYTRTTQKQIVVHMGKGSTIHIGKPMKIIVDYIK